MKLSDLESIDQVIDEQCGADPVFAAQWARGELSRLIAHLVIRYRAECGMSQEQLTAVTGLDIVQLELGDGFNQRRYRGEPGDPFDQPAAEPSPPERGHAFFTRACFHHMHRLCLPGCPFCGRTCLCPCHRGEIAVEGV